MAGTKQAGKKKSKTTTAKAETRKPRKSKAKNKAATAHDDTIDTSGWGFPGSGRFEANDSKQPVTNEPEGVEESPAGDEREFTVGEAVERIKRGELSLVPQLRQALQTQPDFWRRQGNVADMAVLAWARLIADEQNPIGFQSILLRVDEIKRDFAGEAPSPAEQALAETIAACWLRLHTVNAMEASATKSAAGPQTMAVILKQQQQAFRQFNEAVMQLEVLRRLVPSSGT